MSSSLLIILLVVVWLLVLLPMVVNTKEPIRRTSTAFAQTRVLHRGGEERLTPRRHIFPHPFKGEEAAAGGEDVSVAADQTIDDKGAHETVVPSERTSSMAAKTTRTVIQATLPFEEAAADADDVPAAEVGEGAADGASTPDTVNVTDPASAGAGAEVGEAMSDAPTEEIAITPELIQESLDNYETQGDSPVVVDTEIVEADIVAETTSDPENEPEGEDEPIAAKTSSMETDDVESPEEIDTVTDTVTDATHENPVTTPDNSVAEDSADDGAVAVDGDLAIAAADDGDGADNPVSRLGGALAAKIAGFKKTDRNIPEPAPQLTLTAEDIAEAERRRGRGGYDPVAAEAAAQKLYKRRRIVFLVLAVLLVPAIVVAAVFGGMVWIAPAAWCGIIALYLAALRSQVRLENELRQRRLAQMRRAREHRSQYSEREEERPAGSRFRGQYSLVDVDDGDPLFDHLETRPFVEEYMASHAEEFSYDDRGYLRDRFGRVRINASRYPASGLPPQYGYDGADTDYQYDDPYTVGEYSGDRSVDYWGEEEAADNVVRFDVSERATYRNVG